jgi:hypothetical protein
MEAAKIVTGGTRLVSLNNLYLETGWDKLKNRREMHTLVYFYKMKNNISPQYLSDLVPDALNSIHSHNTRNSSIIPPIRTQTVIGFQIRFERIDRSARLDAFR